MPCQSRLQSLLSLSSTTKLSTILEEEDNILVLRNGKSLKKLTPR